MRVRREETEEECYEEKYKHKDEKERKLSNKNIKPKNICSERNGEERTEKETENHKLQIDDM